MTDDPATPDDIDADENTTGYGRLGAAWARQNRDRPMTDDPATPAREETLRAALLDLERRFWRAESSWASKGSGQTQEQQTGAAMVWAWLYQPGQQALVEALGPALAAAVPPRPDEHEDWCYNPAMHDLSQGECVDKDGRQPFARRVPPRPDDALRRDIDRLRTAARWYEDRPHDGHAKALWRAARAVTDRALATPAAAVREAGLTEADRKHIHDLLGTVAFLRSCVLSGESLSPDDEARMRGVCEAAGARLAEQPEASS